MSLHILPLKRSLRKPMSLLQEVVRWGPWHWWTSSHGKKLDFGMLRLDEKSLDRKRHFGRTWRINSINWRRWRKQNWEREERRFKILSKSGFDLRKLKKWAIPGLFFLNFCLFIIVDSKRVFNLNFGPLLYSNHRPLLSEATTLPRDPKPLPLNSLSTNTL